MQTSESTTNIIGAIMKVMECVGYVKKTGNNTFHKYSYVTEKDLIEHLREPMMENGLIAIPSVVGTEIIRRTGKPDRDGNTKDFIITQLSVEYTLFHTSGEWIKSVIVGQGEDEGDKGTYKAMTGASKYFWHKAFMIATGDDPEVANKPEPAPKKPAPKKAAAPKSTKTDEKPSSELSTEEKEKILDAEREEALGKTYAFKSNQVQAQLNRCKESGFEKELIQHICEEIGIETLTVPITEKQLTAFKAGIELELKDAIYSKSLVKKKRDADNG